MHNVFPMTPSFVDLLTMTMNRGLAAAPPAPPPPPPQQPSSSFEVLRRFHQMHHQHQNQNQLQTQCDSPSQLRKLFIGGLSHETTDETLGKFFAQWGPIVDAIVIRDPTTKQSRGFGFVTFASIFSVESAMNDRPHVLGGKSIDSKRAIPREQMSSIAQSPFFQSDAAPGCKLLLSGVMQGVHSVDGLRTYFETFGVLDQVEILTQPRGLGSVIFESAESAARCRAHNNGRHIVNDRPIEVRDFVKPQWQCPTSELFGQIRGRKSSEESQYAATSTTDCYNSDGSSEVSFAEQTLKAE